MYDILSIAHVLYFYTDNSVNGVDSMPETKAQRAANKRYRQGKTSSVQIQLRLEDKAQWDAYAAYKGLPLATLIRGLMLESMQQDEWEPDSKQD